MPHMQPKSYVLQAEPVVVRVTPYGFLRYAKEFLQAAQAIPRQDGFSPVPYYLFCRSLELGLKAFVLAKGDTVEAVKKKLGHDLIKTLTRANALGLAAIVPVSPDELSEVAKANAYYVGKGFEYFQLIPAVTGYPDLASLSVLEGLADRLITAAEPVCLSCS
ncbi:MAG: hypothetical protein ACREOH_18020 [Candidatus Entotheonellia bacterium]